MVPVLSDAVRGTVDGFLDIALWIVGVMILYYLIKLLFVPPPTEADKKKREEEEKARREEFKKWWKKKKEEREAKKKEKKEAVEKEENESEEETEEADEKAEEKEEAKKEEKQEKRERKQRSEAKRLADYLMEVIAYVGRAIKEVQQGDKHGAQTSFRRAKRYITKAVDSEILEEIADGTPYLNQAKMLKSHIVTLRSHMQKVKTLDESWLRSLNQNLGATIKAVGDLVEKIYGGTAAQHQAAARKAKGARAVAKVKKRRP